MIHPMQRLRRAIARQIQPSPTREQARARRASSVQLMVEGLEERVVLSTITWDAKDYPNGGDWDTPACWDLDRVPTATDDVIIKLTAANSSINIKTDGDAARSITSTGPTLIQFSGPTFSLGNGSSSFSGPVAVPYGSTVTMLGATVTNSQPTLTLAGSTLTDNGTLNFNSGDTVTLQSPYGSPAQILVNGTMTTTGAGFATGPNSYPTSIAVNSGGHLTGSNNTFATTNLTFNNGAILNPGELTANTFSTVLTVPATYVPLFVNNKTFGEVDLLNDTLAAGQNLTLPILGAGVSQFYKFLQGSSGYTINSGATLTVDPGVKVTLAGCTLTDNGTLNLGLNSAVTLQSPYGSPAQILVNGTMTTTGAGFATGPNSYPTSIAVNSGGHLTGSNNTFATTNLTFNNGAILNPGELTANTFSTVLTVPATYVPLFVNNKAFGEVDLLNGTLGAGQALELTLMGTLSTASLFYVFQQGSSGYTINSGATLTVDPGVKVTLAGCTLTDNGTLNLGLNSAVTLQSPYGSPAQILVNGTMTTTGAGFATGPNSYPTSIAVNSGGHLTGSNNTFATTNLTFNNGAILNPGELTANTFSTVLTVPATYVPLFVINKAFGEVDLLNGTLGAGQALELTLMGTLSTASLFYVFQQGSSGYTINSGATLTVDPGVKVTLAGCTLTDNGTLNLGLNSAVTLQSPYGSPAQILVNGTMTTTGAGFATGPNSYPTSIAVNSGGQITSVGSKFAPTSVTLGQGATGSITVSQFNTTLNIDSRSSNPVVISGNDFSPILGTKNKVVATGYSNDSITLTNNYWGTSAGSAIAAQITDHATNSSLPTIVYSPYIGGTVGLSLSAPAPVTYSPAAQNVTLSASISGNSGAINEGTVTFQVYNGTVPVGSPTTSGKVSNGTTSVSYALPAGTAAGSYSVQAQYNGTANYLPAFKALVAPGGLTVNKAFPSLNFAVNPLAATYSSSTDQAIPIHLTVSSGGVPVNEGTVTLSFVSGPTTLSSKTFTVTQGAVDDTITLPAGSSGGTYGLQAVFDGSNNYAASAVNPLGLTVNAVATTTTLSSVAPLTYSTGTQPIQLTATVASGGGTVSPGTITFTLVNTATNQQVPGGSAQASVVGGSATTTLTVPANLAAGTYQITAAYDGTANYAASTATSQTLTVGKATPVVTWANPATVGAGTVLGPNQLNAMASVPGTFKYTPAAGTVLAQGLNQALSVVFTPTDSTDYTTMSASVTINVLAATSTVLTLSAPKATYGQKVTFTVAVSAAASNVVPTGTVTWLDGSTTVGSSPVDATGHASFTTATLPLGSQVITAQYSGDSASVASTSSAVLTIDDGARDDFDNDRKTDVAVFRPSTATFYVVGSATGTVATKPLGAAGDIAVPGTYLGPGTTDYAVFHPSTATFSVVNPSTGAVTTKQLGVVGDVPAPGDYDGDGKTDFAVFRPSTATFFIVNSSTGTITTRQFGAVGDVAEPGDYDGDGKTDIAVFRPSTATFYVVASSTGTSIAKQFGVVGDVAVPQDYDGDGRTDFAVFRPSTATYFIVNSSAGGITPGVASSAVTIDQFGAPGDVAVPGDYDGDGKADIAVFRPSTATFFIVNSSTGTVTTKQFGAVGDRAVPTVDHRSILDDFDGDGRADVTVFRPTTATFLILNSATSTTTTTQFGAVGDLPVRGDFDGDGRADLAVFRPSTATFYAVNSATGAVTVRQLGVAGDVAIPGDYDGDGKTDFAVFHPATATFTILDSSTGAIVTRQFGGVGDLPVPGDYDGDGRADIAVFRPSTATYSILASATGSLVTKQFGAPGDVAVTGDFDGDHQADFAVYRPSTSTFFVIDSSTGALVTKQIGVVGDIPLVADFDGDGQDDLAVFHPATATFTIFNSATKTLTTRQWGAKGDVPLKAPNQS